MPMFILFVGFTLYPLIASLRYTFYNWNGIGVPKDFVGFKHYSSIAMDPFFWNAFKNTFIYVAVLVPTQLTIALIMALLLNSKWLKGKNIFRAVFFSPVVTSPAVVGIVASLLIVSVGHDISLALIRFGIIERSIDWLGDPRTAMWIVIVVGVWIGLGYPMIYFLAGLQAIDPELYDAGRLDGAGKFALFRHITIPAIRPVGAVILLLTSLHALKVFDIVQVMTKGGPYFATDVVSTYIYRHAFYNTGLGESESNLGFASAAAFFMGIVVVVISIIQALTFRYMTSRLKGYRRSRW